MVAQFSIDDDELQMRALVTILFRYGADEMRLWL
jgi:hypothetical protein